ncbi:ABC transporter permease [Tenacibaculum sp. M341]|uniref:ABC transporter permease n=1 Tax=Tenacibaculum sp. M341 TaxID=2530339 RepID=UPI00104F11F5|nr:ABC transporter permease [Tenacibaculum sp. M341]TCI92754.1 ABC transporter permease [Tenacibaculum sp. M341]
MFKFIFDSDTWQEIYGGIRKNKVRTIITIIGVLWGIFLLVVLLGAARGMENNFKTLFGDFATNSLAVWTERTDTPFKGFQKGRRIQLKSRDIEILKEEFKDQLQYIAPRCQTSSQILNGFKYGDFQISGDYPVLDKVQKKNLIYGRFLNKNDIKNRSKVVVIEEEICKQLFEKDENPVNQYVIINNVNYKVVGVYKSGAIDFDGEAAYIPFTTFQQVYNRGNSIDWMLVTVFQGVDISQFEKDLQLTLKNLHKVHPKDSKAIGGVNLAKQIGRFTGFLTGMQFLTWFVGIATLIAGVFAIGNILLITVKERTKEIGIRRALGATPREIRQQVILESIFLTTIAGMLGIVFGGFVLYIMDSTIGSGPDPTLLNPTVNIPIILIAFTILIILGTAIGLIPAYMATLVKPIEALREE